MKNKDKNKYIQLSYHIISCRRR